MAITHIEAVRDDFCLVVSTAVDFGPAAGNCVLLTGVTEVATIVLNTPNPFDTPSAGVMLLDVAPVPEDPAATGNASQVDSFEFQDSTGTVVFTGDDVRLTAGGDLELSKNPIQANDIVQLTSFSYTASP
jgi:hypothetical protein